jgi:hypothetical protein
MAQQEIKPTPRPTPFSTQGSGQPENNPKTPAPTIPSKARDGKNFPADVHKKGAVG